jgi:arginine repressor
VITRENTENKKNESYDTTETTAAEWTTDEGWGADGKWYEQGKGHYPPPYEKSVTKTRSVDDTDTNTANTKKNKAYQNVVNIANNTVGGEYKKHREFIRQLDIDEATKTKLENSFDIFYSNEKLPLESRWDPTKALNAPVPLSESYKNTEFAATEETLDIVNAALKNASKTEPSKIFNETDKKFTKKFIEQAGFKSNEELVQLLEEQGETGTTLLTGLQAGTLTKENLEEQKTKLDATITELESKKNNVGNTGDVDTKFYKTQTYIPSVKNAIDEWERAKKENDLDVLLLYNNDENDFYRAHYAENSPKDKSIRAYKAGRIKNVNTEELLDIDKKLITNITALTPEQKDAPGTTFEAYLANILGADEIKNTKKYGALAQNVLKDTIAELEKVKAQEAQWDMYRNLGGFAEILDLGSTLADSIRADVGVGGFLPKGNDVTKDLETQLGNITGIQSHVTYNWQKWFDETLTKKYGIDYTEFAATEETLDIVNAALKNASKTEPSKIFNETDKKFTKKFIEQAGFKSNEELVQLLEEQGETGTTLLTGLQAGTLTKENLEEQKTKLDATITELESKKNRDLKLTFKDGEKIPEEVAVEASFARQFIDEYLKPRFDYSKSMDEFRDYMNVDKEYKNPFQTTDRLTQIKDYAYEQAKQIATNLKDETYNELYINSTFDENFYMNPVDEYANENKQNIYKEQTETINATWESVKNNPDQLIDPTNPGSGTWAEYAYYYGSDLTKQRDFAALHYDLIGKRKNFDAAKDPASKLQEKLDQPIYEKAQSIGTVFGEFITADGFADQVVKNINPLDNNEGWKKVITKFNLDSDTSTDEVRDAIKASITTGSSQVIRNNIKELQELGKTPTQKNLGASYIERPEADTTSAEKSELYNKFKAAGYKGTEQEFYSNYMPDTSPEDIRFLSSVTKGKIPEVDTSFLKGSDPFAMLDKISELESPIPRSTKKAKSDSYFKIGLDDEEEDLPSADSFLGDYASLFK